MLDVESVWKGVGWASVISAEVGRDKVVAIEVEGSG